MRLLLIALFGLALIGCESLIYKLPTRQGNVLEQKQLDQLKLGMTREQVRFLLGTPIATSPFRSDRWDYLGYYKSPRGKVASRTVSLYFDGEQLARMEGVQMAQADKALETPDVDTLLSDEQKQKLEEERAKQPETGIVIQQPGSGKGEGQGQPQVQGQSAPQ